MPDAATDVLAADLPYMDDYLREVLRPRVERVIQSIERTLPDMVLRQVLKLIAAEQPAASEAMQATVRSLVENRLGLQLRVTVERDYAVAEGPVVDRPAEVNGERGAPLRADLVPRDPMPEVITRRRGPESMPLVSAVLNSGRVK